MQSFTTGLQRPPCCCQRGAGLAVRKQAGLGGSAPVPVSPPQNKCVLRVAADRMFYVPAVWVVVFLTFRQGRQLWRRAWE